MTSTRTVHVKPDPFEQKEKAPPGASWKDNEEHVLPKNRLCIVFLGLMCTRFLAALDQTIMATALPTVVAQLGGGNSYSWVGSAYLLASAAFGPLYGKLSNIFGQKPIFYSSILIFLFGSAMCGAAQNMTWLIACRAIQGIGGGGINQLVNTTISDIVPLKDRGRYGGVIGATYSIASVLGPLLGGMITEHISWRWCFFINLPTGGIAAIIIFVFLNLNPQTKRPIVDQLAELDFIGLVCFVGGVVCFLIGLDFNQTKWSDAKTVALLVIGIILLISGGINERYTKRSAILPPRLFRTRTTGIILTSVFCHAFISIGVSYYLPLFYQVLGASASGAGIKMLLFSLGSSTMAVASGFILSKTGKYRPIIWAAYAMITLGMGLMSMLTYKSTLIVQEVFPLIAAIGIGPLFQVPLVALQAAMPLKDMATASSGYAFLRSVGGAVGISVGEAIISNVLPQKLAQIPDFPQLGLGTTAAGLNDSVRKIHSIPNADLRDSVLRAWSEAIGMIWLKSAPIAGCMFILTLFLREYALDRKTVRGGETKTSGDLQQRKAECMIADNGKDHEEPTNTVYVPLDLIKPVPGRNDETVSEASQPVK